MTDHEKDAAHARDELRQATLLLSRIRGMLEADEVMGVKGSELPSRVALLHDIHKFMRRTSLFPKADA